MTSMPSQKDAKTASPVDRDYSYDIVDPAVLSRATARVPIAGRWLRR